MEPATLTVTRQLMSDLTAEPSHETRGRGYNAPFRSIDTQPVYWEGGLDNNQEVLGSTSVCSVLCRHT